MILLQKATYETNQIIQNRIFKIYNKDWYTHTNILHNEINLLQIQDILFSLFQLTFVPKQQQANCQRYCLATNQRKYPQQSK